MLMLTAELLEHDTADGRRWGAMVAPLAAVFERRFIAFLPKATYPIRVGTHFNSAFALVLAYQYATVTKNESFAALLRDSAVRWFGGDVRCQAWEPGGDDFLSSALMEALCMRLVLPAAEFTSWFEAFLPDLANSEPATLFSPAIVSDRTDGKIAHLDGLNLSRAWCWRSLAASWAPTDARRTIATEAAQRHLDASLRHVAGDYSGEHWLATFATLALDDVTP